MFSELFDLIVPEHISFIWGYWGIELLVLANFVFQVILTFNGSRRRHTPGNRLSLIVWFSYLLAAKIATVVLGKLTTIDIGHEQRNTHTQVQALLAPLMFMQIGNPDTITAYSIEDNQLGVRQVFSMVIQVGIMFYILVRSWTDSKTSFLYLPMSLAGIIKYGETSWALKSALNGNFGFTIADFFKYHEVADLFNKLPQGENELPEANLILRAYYRFCCLKPHLENWLYYPPTDCDQGKLHIKECGYEDVFRITDVELGFMYDALYTKAPVVYTRKGLILRLISLLSVIATLVGFSVLFKDAFVYNISIGFIHFVLIAALIIEIYQILRLPFTDWAIVQMVRHHEAFPILRGFLRSLSPQSATWRRWSNTMGQFNLLEFCLQTKHRNYSRIKILRYMGMDMKLRKQLSLDRIDVSPEVKEFVVTELREIEAIKGEEEFDQRGQWTINRYKTLLNLNNENKLIKAIETTVSKRPFDKCIFIWHITTNIFYNIEGYRDTSVGNKTEAIMSLSDYMMYLVVTRSHVLSTTTADIIFDHSCVKLGKFTRTGRLKKEDICNDILKLKKESILHAREPHEPIESEAEKVVVGNWHLMKDVKELADCLLALSNENKWKLIGSMWFEMLGYAASKCEMEYHSEHIRQGGELITHVWLLIAHNVTKYSSYEYHAGGQDEETPATS
ncbi:uncharacterized protein LOC101214084 [Cucumis sativus]|uniref:DUF4220 domain-containing protein n=1 Tax=Cucumis sativus TaxID=3659 RepID=A0A0A0LK45_CUCSA|nr:uncharacterized protein LOC101214084 [Cucumis sativus]KGN61067.1 hypothetical protein Csa_021275 [Cucumis sativus]